MTKTLLLRLAGPMQSWGTQSRFRDRDTGREPSKSGVVGLLCAALGRPRSATIADLAALRMGVRIDRAGVVRVDYQTAGGTHRQGESYGVARAENPGTETAISRRAYLADASFLVGLEARTPEQEALLAVVDRALAAPVWPLYLGRKGYVPGRPIRLADAPSEPGRLPEGPGLRDGPLEKTLNDYSWDAVPSWENTVRLVIESNATDADDAEARAAGELRNDWPLSFEPLDRRFATRSVVTRLLRRQPSVESNAEPGPKEG